MTKVPELHSYVSQHLPFELVFVECTGTRAEAFEAEMRIKKWSRKKKEALIEQNWEKLSFWSKKGFNCGIISRYISSFFQKLRNTRDDRFIRSFLVNANLT